MTFALNDDRVAVRVDEVEETTTSGLILTEGGQSPLRYGVVTHVGNGHVSEVTGEWIAPPFEVGQRVFFHRASGQMLAVDGAEYLFLAPREIIGRFLENES